MQFALVFDLFLKVSIYNSSFWNCHSIYQAELESLEAARSTAQEVLQERDALQANFAALREEVCVCVLTSLA